MTYRELSNNAVLAGAIKIIDGAKKLDGNAAIDVVMAQAELERGMSEYQSKMQDIVKKLKPEDYDERSKKQQKMLDIEARAKAVDEWDGEGEEPKMPTDEELKEAEELKQELEGFDKEEKELDEQLGKAAEKLMNEESSIKKVKLSRETLAAIYAMVEDPDEESGVKMGGHALTNREFLVKLAVQFVA